MPNDRDTVEIRDYTITYFTQFLQIGTTDKTKLAYAKIPTEDEANDAFGVSGLELRYYSIFKNCHSMRISPSILDAVYTTFITMYDYCEELIYPPVIPSGVNIITNMFRGCSKLLKAPSVPNSVTQMLRTFRECTALSGEMVIRPTTLTQYNGCFVDTVEDIVLYGDKTICQTLAATANNGNVTWSDWYDAETAVTNRGEGSRTTASDFQRMVRNGVLAVSSYCPARMTFSDTDIVHQDEWIALCDAAKTIDNTITYSTHYTNLNKIESAFDSAL